MNNKLKTMLLIIGCMAISMNMVGCEKDKKTVSTTTSVEVEDKSNKIDVFGNVKAMVVKEIHINFPASVEKIHVKKGDILKEGDKIFTLDYDDYKQDIYAQEKEIELLKVELDSVYSKMDASSVQISQKNSVLQIKESYLQNESSPKMKSYQLEIEALNEQISLLEKEYNTDNVIAEVGGISENELKQKLLKINQLKKERDQARENIENEKQNLRLEIDELRSSIKSLQTTESNTVNTKKNDEQMLAIKIQMAEDKLESMKDKINKNYLVGDDIVATDESALIYDIKVNEGSILEEGNELCSLIDTSKLMIQVNIPESFVSKIKIGDKADIKFTAASGEVFEGKLVNIANNVTVVNGENMVKAEIAIVGEQKYLKEGYEVDAVIYYE